MKTRTAVALEAKIAIEMVGLDLEGPKAGEVLVEIMATGICHTNAYTLDGLDSEGIREARRFLRGRRLLVFRAPPTPRIASICPERSQQARRQKARKRSIWV